MVSRRTSGANSRGNGMVSAFQPSGKGQVKEGFMLGPSARATPDRRARRARRIAV
jgi:hypothetical protein